MPHTGTPPSKSIRGKDPPREVKGEKNLGPGRRFVPGVAAGICRRPNDRPRAETHPPNASINVCLVNSGKNCRSPGACFVAPLPRKPQRSRRAYRLSVSLWHTSLYIRELDRKSVV